MLTPKSRTSRPPDNRPWCADNGVFTGRFDWPAYYGWLKRMKPYRTTCKFVTCPDVIANAVATLDRYRYYAWRIKALGFQVALVAQDGLEDLPWPPEYDALFIGGSTAWKLSPEAAACLGRAKRDGKWVHAGRVNSQKRLRYFQLLGADSADGTTVTFEPDTAYRRLNVVLQQKPLLQEHT